MSFVDPSSEGPSLSAMRLGWIPRAGLLLVLALACAIVLGLVASSTQPPPADGRQPAAGYPLRVALPGSYPVMRFELPAPVDILDVPSAGSSVTEQPVLPGEDALPPQLSSATALQKARPAPVTLKPGEFLPLDFKLAGAEAMAERYDAGDGSLTVTKPLFVDGRSVGPARIRIESAAQIYIASASVADALGDKVSALPRRVTGMLESRSGFVPFNELRAAGVRVEYDAATDRIAISSPS